METQRNTISRKASLILALSVFVVLVQLQPLAAQAPVSMHRSLEVKSSPKGYNYLSYDMLLGMRSFQVSSGLAPINGMHVAKAGGSFGAMYGNEMIKGYARIGLFFAGMHEKHTVDMMDTDLGMQVSIPALFAEKARKLDVYLTGGYSTQLHTFRGSYIKTEPQLVSNNPNLEPLIGRILSHNLNYGAGISYTLRSDYQFFTFMAEYKASGAFKAQSSGYLGQTSIQNVSLFNLGFRTGALRAKRN